MIVTMNTGGTARSRSWQRGSRASEGNARGHLVIAASTGGSSGVVVPASVSFTMWDVAIADDEPSGPVQVAVEGRG